MGLRDIFNNIFGRNGENEMLCIADTGKLSLLSIRRLCFFACVNMVASAVSKCEIKTFQKHKEIKGAYYYAWNIEPNKNQCSSNFILEMITKLFIENEVLVFSGRGKNSSSLFIADSYEKIENGIDELVFNNIEVNGETIEKTKKQSDVIFLRLSSKNIKNIIDNIFYEYEKLISYGIGNYKRENGNKGFLKLEKAKGLTKEEEAKLRANILKEFNKFFAAENATLPLYRGEEYESLQTAGENNKSGNNSRDIKALIMDIMEYTAIAFGIPPTLLTGNIENTSNAIDQLLTFCVDPLTDSIAEELNRKLYTKNEYLEGSYIKIDTTAVKHIDLLSVANAVDKLIGSGAFTIDDIRKTAGAEPKNTDWSNQHYLTKNYSLISDIANNTTENGKNVKNE